LHYTDVRVFADTLCEHGPEVIAIDPPELVEAVTSQLTLLGADHGR
jgi:hypothetical protein